ncbi:hypothetical protein Clacol_009469 [Clathrus columnatus]|uniref:Transmembrane protein n=1 Tax=Clathrus columnatus TaxID=1419009 RepID=A0AAV5AR72_9AGAM|nr:hypothetical protein Clacol_009469 [Clathrus columnatus]
MAGLFTMAPPMAPTSTPSQVSNGSDAPGGRGPPNSSLLFGFLVSFLALFIVFMVCGLGSRHYVDLRRRERRLQENPPEDSFEELPPPELWDVSVAPGESEWKVMMPLSVEIQRDEKPESPEDTLRSQQLSYYSQLSFADRVFYSCGEFTRRLWISLRDPPARRFDIEASIPSPFTLPIKPQMTSNEVDLQISVIVAMPSPHRRRHRNDSVTSETIKNNDKVDNIDEFQEDGLPDVTIGVTKVRWEKERLDLDDFDQKKS